MIKGTFLGAEGEQKMKSVTEINCVCCPNHCLVRIEEGVQTVISGNRCENGSAYALGQLREPERVVEGEVHLRGAAADRCRVKLDRPVPTGKLEEIAKIMREFWAEAPVAAGQLLLTDIAGSGAALLAAEDVPANGR